MQQPHRHRGPAMFAQAVLPAAALLMSNSRGGSGPSLGDIIVESGRRVYGATRSGIAKIPRVFQDHLDTTVVAPPVYAGTPHPIRNQLHKLKQKIKSARHAKPLPLVGIELNPGPKTKVKMQPQPRKKKSKALVLVTPARRSERTYTTVQNAPVSASATLRPYTRFATAKAHGKNGLLMSGTQRLCTVQTNSSGVAFLDGTTISNYQVDPTVMKAPLASIAKGFQRFRFREISFHYRSTLSSSTTGGIYMGYTSDGYAADGTINPNSITTLENSVETNCWANASISVKCDPNENLFYNFATGTNPGDIRSANQGQLLLTGLANGVNSATIGDVWVSYVVEMYELGDEPTLEFDGVKPPHVSALLGEHLLFRKCLKRKRAELVRQALLNEEKEYEVIKQARTDICPPGGPVVTRGFFS